MKTIVRVLNTVRLVDAKRQLPENWKKVAGILRGRKKLLETHVKTVRGEWK